MPTKSASLAAASVARPNRRLALAAAALAVLLALLPLTLTPVLPLVDAYAHAARFFALSGRLPPELAVSYKPFWTLLPNLGVDVLGTGLMRLLEPLAAMKAIGVLMVVAPLAGILALSAALHGRASIPAALIGGVLGIGHITIWGFINFLVGAGAMLGAVALWVALERRPGVQLATSIALGILLLMLHGLAFMFWGLVLGGVELGRAFTARAEGGLRPAVLIWRVGRLILLGILPFLLWRAMPTSGAEEGLVGGTVDRFAAYSEAGKLWGRLWAEALDRLGVILRVGETGWLGLDLALGAALWGLIGWALWTRRLTLHPLMVVPAAIMAVLTVLMPPSLFGVGYVSDRLPLLLACVLAAGLAVPPGAWTRARPVLVGLALVLVLDGLATAAVWSRQGGVYTAYLDAIATLPVPVAEMPVAAPIFLDEAGQRGSGSALACKPLAPLLTLTGTAAVHIFANPTQQPLRLSGPLAAASARTRAGTATQAGPLDQAAHLFSAGHDLVIVCRGREGPIPDGLNFLAEGRHWGLATALPNG